MQSKWKIKILAIQQKNENKNNANESNESNVSIDGLYARLTVDLMNYTHFLGLMTKHRIVRNLIIKH